MCKNPMLAFALADAVRTRVGSAETTVVRSGRGYWFHTSEAAPEGDRGEREITRAEALATTLNRNPDISNLCPEAQLNPQPAEGLGNAEIEIDLQIDAEVPEHVFAVWSEGEKVGDPADDVIVFLPEAK